MIKNYANSSSTSTSVNFIYKASRRRRMIAMDSAKQVQLDLGIAPKLSAVK